MIKPYIHTEDVHNLNAPMEVVPIIIELINPKSVLDVGCGTGTWLKVFEENGVGDYLGIDGKYVDKDVLKIPISKFKEADLTQDWLVSRRFDLVLCLEVAEHLPEVVADKFVESLTRNSDTIIFSAAIPGQGGQNHLNEQWPEYWQNKFVQHGFYFHDIIRPLIWENQKIDWWYRQNIFLINKMQANHKIMRLCHPELFEIAKISAQEQYHAVLEGKYGVWETFKIFIKSIKFKLFR